MFYRQSKKNKIGQAIFRLIFLVVVGALVCLFVYWRGINVPIDHNGESRNFPIEKGEGANEISEKLHQDGLIGSKLFFELYVWQKDWENKLLAGNHYLSPTMSIRDIARSLISESVPENETKIKIIEGWNLGDIGQYFESLNMFQREEFEEIAGFPQVDYNLAKDMPRPVDFSADYGFLADKPKNYGLEGYLFPDTYKIFNNASVEDIIRKMLDNFGRKFSDDLAAETKRRGLTVYEILTMASILEKEVKTEEDMEIVSGIFWDRIKGGQALQSCATLAYILGQNKDRYTTDDTKTESPYNTYLYRGLPPGPISNPGLNAIRAAIYPASTDYNYFLTDPKTGKTIFSRTYEEHLKNKIKYLY